ncbi:MAG: carboxypeptidase regulatory-like domain-containing protein, partial [Rhodococcus sp.]|nr:carboxypeptidase regulatory-like domain-containing protein [Rhodococcus sp. (in: high G+C Gram-positive bacteria)]
TDSQGRYVAEGFGASTCRNASNAIVRRNAICVKTAEEGSDPTTDHDAFAANTPTRIDIDIEDATEVATISGRVTHTSGGAGVSGVLVWVDGEPPINKNTKIGTSKTNNAYATGSDGSFSVRTKADGRTAKITVSKDGMFFSPEAGHTFSAVAGTNITGIVFNAFDNGTIHGRVVDASDDPIGGVLVTAQQVGGTAMDTMTTTATTGSYSLSVRHGLYNVTATKPGYDFTDSDTTGVNVPNDGKALRDLVGMVEDNYSKLSSLSLSGVTRLCRTAACQAEDRGFRSADTVYTATVDNSLSMTTLTTTVGGGAKVIERYPDDADATTAGHQIALDVGTTDIEVVVASMNDKDTTTYTVAVTRLGESTTITGTVTDAQSGDPIGSVRITPTGGNLLNGGRNAYVSTNASGKYEVIMESGGPTTLKPSKTGYTFEPGNRSVELNAGTVTGADFTGSKYATITGVVMAGTTALDGVKVEATVMVNGEAISDDDTSDRRGRFSVSVPAGTATVTATKTGYTFASQTVSLVAGESRSLGNVMATDNVAPAAVAAARDTADTGAGGSDQFTDNVTVTWEPGPGGRAGSYQVQVKDTVGDWQNFGDAITGPVENTATTALGDSTWTHSGNPGDAGNDNTVIGEYALTIRVMATDTAAEPDVDYASDEVPVAAINPVASNVLTRRNTDAEPDSLVVTWEAKGNTNSGWRVAVQFGDEEEWYVVATDQAGGTRLVALLANDTSDLTQIVDGTGTPKTLTPALLNGAVTFRVDHRQGTNADWVEGMTATLAAKSSG